ncbi:MAG: HAD-IIB family hydrolase [Ahrensia sp.]
MSTPNLIVFSDLDGTLLDHDTYSWDEAKPALAALKERSIPLVLASSKTAAEMAPLRKALGFEHCPAIVENGAGLLAAHTHEPQDGHTDYDNIRTALNALPAGLRAHFSGFGDMGVDGIIETTGLPRDQAERAARRAFSEPGLWSGNAAEHAEFESALATHGIKARSGGRFLTLSFGRTKAGQMRTICDTLFGDRPVTIIALGDAPNDTEMLLAADRGFIISNPHAKPIQFPPDASTKHIETIAETSPLGWNQAVLSVVL